VPQNLIAVGISHHAVPVELREKLAMSEDEVRQALARLRDKISDEALIVSTCNRTEIYARATYPELTQDYLVDFILEAKAIPREEQAVLRQHFSKLSYCDAIKHLFEVVSGIDSQIVGDQQIFGQIKDSFRLSEESGLCGTFMTKFAHAAFRVAKRARTETDILAGAGTISYAAVEFARKVYGDLSDHTAMMIGAGETAEIAAKYLVEKGIRQIYVANRTLANAEDMISRLGLTPGSSRAKTFPLEQIGEHLHECAIVISSTASESIVLGFDDVRSALEKRKSLEPLVLVDIAVPRDIDPKVKELSNVFLADIDDLTSIVDKNMKKRTASIPAIEKIIDEEFKNFLDVYAKLEVGPTIKELRDKFDSVRQEELDRHREKLSPEAFKLVDDMTRKMMNRLLHSPTVMLREPRSTKDDLEARVQMVRALFALEGEHHDHEE
jgi:glutamyl-tRNA reductase